MEKEMKGGKRREVKEGKKQDSRSTRYAGYVRRGGGGGSAEICGFSGLGGRQQAISRGDSGTGSSLI